MLRGREEAEAILSMRIDEFLDELKESYDDDLVEKMFERKLERVQIEDDKEIIERIETLLGELNEY
jgi:hypothetical protein